LLRHFAKSVLIGKSNIPSAAQTRPRKQAGLCIFAPVAAKKNSKKLRISICKSGGLNRELFFRCKEEVVGRGSDQWLLLIDFGFDALLGVQEHHFDHLLAIKLQELNQFLKTMSGGSAESAFPVRNHLHVYA
jgi:hypothetical protein